MVCGATLLTAFPLLLPFPLAAEFFCCIFFCLCFFFLVYFSSFICLPRIRLTVSSFCCFCLPGAETERPLSNRGEIKRLRPPPSGHAPAGRRRHHPVRLSCSVIV